jgi:hypothetical protein
MQTQVVSQECAELQHWSGLSTVTRFDAGNTGNKVGLKGSLTEAVIVLWFLFIEGKRENIIPTKGGQSV